MRAMRRFAASALPSRHLTGSAARGDSGRELLARELLARELLARGLLARGLLARGLLARGLLARAVPPRGLPPRATVTLRATVLGLIAVIAGTSVTLISLATGRGPATSTRPATHTGPATELGVATAASAPRSTLASVVPSTAIPPSRITFAVYCASAGATSATLLGRTLGLTEHIKMRPNRAAGDFTVSVILPGSIQPGTYHPSIECSDGTSTTARLLVPEPGTAGSTSGGVATWLTAGGLALIGLGAVTRSIVLRRRKRGDPGDGDPRDGSAGDGRTGDGDPADRRPGDSDPGSLSPLRRWQDQAARSRYF